MTKIGVVSDIHGNIEAMLAVHSELMMEHEVDEVVCCGDVVGVLGWPLHCVYMVEGVCDHVVLGNHDARVHPDYSFVPSFPAAHDEHSVVTDELDEDAISILQEWPERIETDEFIMAHSFPAKVRDSDRSITGFNAGDYGVKPRDVPKAGKHADGKFIFLGHSHEQFEQSVDKFQGQSGHIVNPGSVGVPWHEPAEYAVVNTERGDVGLHSVEYDNFEVDARMWDLHDEHDLRTWEEAHREARS